MANRFVHIIAAALIILITNGTSTRAQDAETQKAIIELMEVTGMMKVMDQLAIIVTQNVIQKYKKKYPDFSEKAATIVQEEMTSAFREGIPLFMAQAMPLYGKYFTKQEINDLIAFYKTKTGQKAMRTYPMLVQEGMAIGQKWGEQIAPDALEKIKTRLRGEGIEL